MITIKKFLPLKLIVLVSLASSVLLYSCKDDETVDLSAQEEVGVVQQTTVADNSVDEELEAFDESIVASEGGRLREDECPTVTRDEGAKTITLDFGTSCIGRYGRERSGKVIITYGGVFGDDMANRTVTFDNYFVNNKQIEGTILLRNINRNDEGNLTAERELVDYKVTFPAGDYNIINGSTTREWIEGENDGVRGNEVIEVTGSYEGINSKGVEFSRVITEPVRADFSCWADGGFLRTQGVIEMTITNSARSRTRVLDYGDGTCDNSVTVTVNDQSYTISIED
jgi:hypothetical protein